MPKIYIENYSERSIAVLGDTKPHKDALKSMGGKFNSRLKDNKVGWIFPKTFETQVKDYIDCGKISVLVKHNSNNSSFDQKLLETKIDNLDKKLELVITLLHQIMDKRHTTDGKNSQSNDILLHSGSPPVEKRRLLRRL